MRDSRVCRLQSRRLGIRGMMYVKPLVIPMFPETIAAIVTAGFRWVHVIRPMTTIPNFLYPVAKGEHN